MRFRNASQGPSYNPGRRYLMFVLLLLAMFGYLLSGVFRLQLLSSEEYAENGILITALVDKLHASDYLPYVTE